MYNFLAELILNLSFICSRLTSLLYNELDDALKAGKVTIDPDVTVLLDFNSIRVYFIVAFVDFNSFKPLTDNVLLDVNDISDFKINLPTLLCL